MFEWTGKKKEWTENIETVIVIIVFSMSKKVRGDKEIQKKKNTQIESLEIKNDTWDEKVHRMAVKENCCCHLHYTRYSEHCYILLRWHFWPLHVAGVFPTPPSSSIAPPGPYSLTQFWHSHPEVVSDPTG